jgi:hypothetical protein
LLFTGSVRIRKLWASLTRNAGINNRRLEYGLLALLIAGAAFVVMTELGRPLIDAADRTVAVIHCALGGGC